MATRSMPRVHYNGQLLLEDAAAKGLDAKKLSAKSKLSLRTVYRFLTGEVQTTPTANALAKVVGRDVARYVVRTAEAVAL